MDATFAWIAVDGLRLDDPPDDRSLSHLSALRAARDSHDGQHPLLTRLASRLGYQPVSATADPGACCIPA